MIWELKKVPSFLELHEFLEKNMKNYPEIGERKSLNSFLLLNIIIKILYLYQFYPGWKGFGQKYHSNGDKSDKLSFFS